MGLRIKEILKEKRLSVNELAERMGINRVGLSNHINGNPSVEVLERIASAIGCEISDLFERKSQANLTALIEYNKHFYKAENLEKLKEIVTKIEKDLNV